MNINDSEISATLQPFGIISRNQTFQKLTTTPSDLDIDWGPKRDPLYIVVPITIIYVIIFITGVVGNISTCVVISRNKSMHTATNYYLFSLAISDLLLLISGLPPDMYSIWFKYPYMFGEAFCVIQGFAAETSANATVLTITAFTVERYVAICHPFLSHTMSKLSRAVKYIIAVWIVAMLLAIPQALSFEIIYGQKEGQCVCTVTDTLIPHAFGISTLLFFVTPMSLITILYILIGLQLHKSTVGPSRGNSVRLKHRVVSYTPSSTQPVIVLNGNAINGNSNGNSRRENENGARVEEDGRKNFARNAQATKHVVKMLVAVVVAFFICWAPFHAQRLFAIYGTGHNDNMISAYRILNYISGILYFLSTSINPFLYHIMSHKFREAFKDTFKGLICRNRRAKGVRCYSTLSGRSSQINSHSNTDSCSRQSSLRYLEAEMARLHDSKRPLVVSFKRKNVSFPRKPKQVTILDAELQEALDNLNEVSIRCDLFEKVRQHLHEGTSDSKNALREDVKSKQRSHRKRNNEIEELEESESITEFSYVEVHSLEPSHICPVTGKRGGNELCCHFSDDRDKMKVNRNRSKVRKDLRNVSRKREKMDDNEIGNGNGNDDEHLWNTELIKSSTMPDIIIDESNNDRDHLDNQRDGNESKELMQTSPAKNERNSGRSKSCSQLEFQGIGLQKVSDNNVIDVA